MTPASAFEEEIHQQPEVLHRLLTQGREAAERVADRVRAFAPKLAVLVARGSSDNAARYAQYVLGANNHLPVALAAPSLLTLYGSPPSVGEAWVVGISQSGQSPDIVEVLADARRQGALTLALTNDPASPLAQAAELCLPLLAGEERAVAATKTYTAQLLALAMLSAALERSGERWAELAGVPAAVRDTLALNGGGAAAVERFRDARYFVAAGRGFNYATAFEIALKLKETSYLIAEPYSTADFLHGPVAMLGTGFPLLLVAPRGKATADLKALLALAGQRQAELVAISNDDEVLAGAATQLRLPEPLPEWLSPIAAVVPGQLFALWLARARGVDPDQPRGLRKVTLTR